jgi:hypothetical protein
MIVWAGYDGNNGVNTGGKYNPGTNSWTATTTTNAPEPRFDPQAVWTGSEMIIWGGTGKSWREILRAIRPNISRRYHKPGK